MCMGASQSAHVHRMRPAPLADVAKLWRPAQAGSASSGPSFFTFPIRGPILVAFIGLA